MPIHQKLKFDHVTFFSLSPYLALIYKTIFYSECAILKLNKEQSHYITFDFFILPLDFFFSGEESLETSLLDLKNQDIFFFTFKTEGKILIRELLIRYN